MRRLGRVLSAGLLISGLVASLRGFTDPPRADASAISLGPASASPVSMGGGGLAWVTGSGNGLIRSTQMPSGPLVQQYTLSDGASTVIAKRDSNGQSAFGSRLPDTNYGASDDGRWILFNAGSTGLDSSAPTSPHLAYLRDTVTEDTIVVPFPVGDLAAISNDGQRVLFWASSPDIATSPPGTVPYSSVGYRSVWLWDRSANTVTEVPHGFNQTSNGPASSDLDRFMLTGGRVVEFSTGRSALLGGDTYSMAMSRNGRWLLAPVGNAGDLYRFDVDNLLVGGNGNPVLVSVSDDEKLGDSSGNCVLNSRLYRCHGAFGKSAIDNSGNIAVFSSTAPLVSKEENAFAAGAGQAPDVYVRDLVAGTTTLLSDYPGAGLTFNTGAQLLGASADTKRVVMRIGASVWTREISSDTTPPIVSPAVDRAPDNGAWYVDPVTVSWSAIDDVDGQLPAPASTTVSTDGFNQIVASSPVCDASGNCATGSTTISMDQTPPSIHLDKSPVANSAGWNNSAVTVTSTCNDQTSGVAYCAAPATILTAGANQTATLTASDVAGNVTAVASEVSIDLTPPSITLNAPQDGSTVTLAQYQPPSCVAADNLSGLDGVCATSVVQTGSVPGAIGYTATATASDIAGNNAVATSSYTVVTDASAPTILAAPDRPANGAGWWSDPVTFSFACTDDSGVQTCPGPQVVATDGSNQSFSVVAADIYGNSGALVVAGINIDSVAPVLAVSAPSVVGPAATVSIHCAASDALSGIQSASCADSTFPATELVPGANTFTFVATDMAGNSASQTVTVVLSVTPLSIGGLVAEYLGNTAGAAGIQNSLTNKLQQGQITAFINQVEAQCCRPSGNKRFTRTQADTLIALAAAL